MGRNCPSCGTALPPGRREEFCVVCTLQGALEIGRRNPQPPALLRQVGTYELIEEVARGGAGVIYRATQLGLGRDVALKLLIAGPLADATTRQRFRAEAEAAAQLRHPHIVAIHEVGDHEGQPYLAMEFLSGGTLADRVRDGPLSSREAAAIGVKIARAVAFAHDAGILHRDLKPSNILLDAFGEPKLTDFGLAKAIGYRAEAGLTLPGQVLGSPGFMSPEQVRGRAEDIGRATDIYSLGALVYQLVTARAPFQGESTAAVLRLVETEEPIPPRRLNAGIDRDFEQILLKCLEKSPTRRYASAHDLAADLERFLNGQPVKARPLGAVARAWRWSRRRPAFAIAFVLLSAIAILSSSTAWRIRRAELTARQNLDRAYQNAYAGDLALADRAIEDGDLARTRELLERHIPTKSELDLRTFEWRLLWNQSTDESSAQLTGHKHVVSAVAYFPDGDRLASGSWDGTVRFWKTPEGTLERTLTDYRGQIWTIDISSDGRRLLVSGNQGFAIWQHDQDWWFRGRIVGDFSYGTARFLPNPSQVIVANRQGATVWNITNGVRVLDLPEAASPVAISPDGQRLATRLGNQLSIFDTATWNVLRRFKTGNYSSFGLRDLAFSPDGKRVLIGDYRGWLASVDLSGSETNVSEITLSRVHPQPHHGWVGEIVFSPDGQYFASVGADQRVRVWRPSNGRLRFDWRGHRHEVWAARFSPDGRWLATAGKDESVRLWDLHAPSRTQERTAPVRNVLGVWNATEVLVDAVPDSTRRDRLLQIYDWEQRNILREIPLPSLTTNALIGIQPATGDVAIHGVTGGIEVWNIRSDAPQRRLHLASAVETSPSTSPPRLSRDGTRVGVHGPGTAATLWTIPAGTRPLQLVDAGEVMEIDEQYVYTRPVPNTPRVYDRTTGRRVVELVGHKEPVPAILPLPGGRTVATGGWDGSLRFWSLPDGRLLATTRSQRQGIYGLALTPDGKTLAAGGQDGVTHFWNVSSRQQTTRWVIRRIVHRLWFAPDGQALILDHGNQLSILRVPNDPMRFSP
ncbi:MAG: protein kinase [Verrucomicrobiales bacterium]|nr:protein kinase [Verrucomicrobiales bacterium]